MRIQAERETLSEGANGAVRDDDDVDDNNPSKERNKIIR